MHAVVVVMMVVMVVEGVVGGGGGESKPIHTLPAQAVFLKSIIV